MNLLAAIKLIIAHSKAKCHLKPGATACLMDLVTHSNAAFNAMVKDKIPKKTVVIKRPIHHALGPMMVDGNALLSMQEDKIGS